jgi:putative oxidoreductase
MKQPDQSRPKSVGGMVGHRSQPSGTKRKFDGDRWEVPLRPILGKWSEEAYILLRFMMGFMIACHGVQKVFGLLDGERPAHGIFLVAGVIETIGGLLVMAGFFTSPVALILSGEMAVAYFMVHAGLRFWPLLNGGEIVVANCFAFLYIAAKGPGALSLDEWFDRHQSSSPDASQENSSFPSS